MNHDHDFDADCDQEDDDFQRAGCSYTFVHNCSILIEEIPPARTDCTVVIEIHLTRLKKFVKINPRTKTIKYVCLCYLPDLSVMFFSSSPFLYENKLVEMKTNYVPLINKDQHLGS